MQAARNQDLHKTGVAILLVLPRGLLRRQALDLVLGCRRHREGREGGVVELDEMRVLGHVEGFQLRPCLIIYVDIYLHRHSIDMMY